jgi:hypothetical protein
VAYFKVLSRHSPGLLRKATEELNQCSRYPDRNLITGSHKYEAGILTAGPRRSVSLHLGKL